MKGVKSTLHRGREGQNVPRAKFLTVMAKVVGLYHVVTIGNEIICSTDAVNARIKESQKFYSNFH